MGYMLVTLCLRYAELSAQWLLLCSECVQSNSIFSCLFEPRDVVAVNPVVESVHAVTNLQPLFGTHNNVSARIVSMQC